MKVFLTMQPCRGLLLEDLSDASRSSLWPKFDDESEVPSTVETPAILDTESLAAFQGKEDGEAPRGVVPGETSELLSRQGMEVHSS